ncbi:hypothetical protein C8024_15255, partial [Sphingopyxis sp. BSNA05]|nr:hypothetical protein [Sphingopyxis sp. BSNA05]
MAGESKIIGMWRDRDESAGDDQTAATAGGESDVPEQASEQPDFSEEYHENGDESPAGQWDEYADETASAPARARFIPLLLLTMIGLCWTGFFLWANRDIFT